MRTWEETQLMQGILLRGIIANDDARSSLKRKNKTGVFIGCGGVAVPTRLGAANHVQLSLANGRRTRAF